MVTVKRDDEQLNSKEVVALWSLRAEQYELSSGQAVRDRRIG